MIKWQIKWTKDCSGRSVYEDGVEKFDNLNIAFKMLEMYKKESPMADGFIEEIDDNTDR